MKHPKDYRHEIYTYIEGLLERPLSFEEHDDLQDMLNDYASMRNLGLYVRRALCRHNWSSDNKIEGGQKTLVHMKCTKCDKRKLKKMPAPAAYR
ncbi:MAG TPA: hypothetical protein VGB97_00365 [Candidatus Paceibacterota bacterium]|jgi:hypothetical protein